MTSSVDRYLSASSCAQRADRVRGGSWGQCAGRVTGHVTREPNSISRGWRRFLAPVEGWIPELLVAALLGAPFWGAFAWTMARYQANLPADDPHVEEFHWVGMAVMAIGLVLMVVLASLRTRAGGSSRG